MKKISLLLCALRLLLFSNFVLFCRVLYQDSHHLDFILALIYFKLSKTSCIIHRNSLLSLSVKLLITHFSHGWALESDYHCILFVCHLRLCCCSFFGCCCLGSWNETEMVSLYTAHSNLELTNYIKLASTHGKPLSIPGFRNYNICYNT